MPTGMILKGIGSFYYVKTQETTVECKARGIFRKEEMVPLPGDRVEISIIDSVANKGCIEDILPRTSCLVRPAVANITMVIAVLSVKSPMPDLILIDKLLIAAEKERLKTVLCVNKVDLDDSGIFASIESAYKPAGYKVIALSTPWKAGFDELTMSLKGELAVLAGQSGVGKSTILNTLGGIELMRTSGLSERIERGKHTTRHAELFEIRGGGFVVDTPGFSLYDISGIKKDELQNFYPEFTGYIGKCKFRGCSHTAEPGCAVKEAVETGKIDKGRYARYIQLYGNLKLSKAW